jgi:hypothetical protein
MPRCTKDVRIGTPRSLTWQTWSTWRPSPVVSQTVLGAPFGQNVVQRGFGASVKCSVACRDKAGWSQAAAAAIAHAAEGARPQRAGGGSKAATGRKREDLSRDGYGSDR